MNRVDLFSLKGGNGTTTLAVMVACCAAETRGPTSLVTSRAGDYMDALAMVGAPWDFPRGQAPLSDVLEIRRYGYPTTLDGLRYEIHDRGTHESALSIIAHEPTLLVARADYLNLIRMCNEDELIHKLAGTIAIVPAETKISAYELENMVLDTAVAVIPERATISVAMSIKIADQGVDGGALATSKLWRPYEKELNEILDVAA